MKLEEQLRNDAQSLRELGWFNRAIMMDAGADEIHRLATANKKLREGCEEQKQHIHRLEEESESRWKLAQSAIGSCEEMSSRIRRLEEAGDAMEAWLRDERLDAVQYTVSKWLMARRPSHEPTQQPKRDDPHYISPHGPVSQKCETTPPSETA